MFGWSDNLPAELGKVVNVIKVKVKCVLLEKVKVKYVQIVAKVKVKYVPLGKAISRRESFLHFELAFTKFCTNWHICNTSTI